MHAFCTLFDSNYLDKGIALYRSLSRTMSGFTLYILAMDQRCKDILMHMELRNVVVISLNQFEDDELKTIREKRTRAEYCWTCTASLIDYVLTNYNVEYCTYLDSDLYFYQSPCILLNELFESACSVQIVEHRFGKGAKAARKEKQAGKYCVQFNTFKNDEKGRHVLKVWKEQCRAQCSMQSGAMGDQKYLSTWSSEYDCVQELQNHGGGVAPWNIGRYRMVGDKDQQIIIRGKDTKKNYTLVFYHFHNLIYIDKYHVGLNVFNREWFVDQKLVYRIYMPYLHETECIKDMLEKKYGFRPMIYRHIGIPTNASKSWVQRLQGKSVAKIANKLCIVLLEFLRRKKDIVDLKTV